MPSNPNNPWGIDYSALSNLLTGASRRNQPYRPYPEQEEVLGEEGPNPSLELDYLQGQRRDELRGRLSGPGAAYTPANELAGYKSQLDDVEEDMESSVIGQQRPVTEAYSQQLRQANAQGYATPQELAAYQRNIAEEQMRQPLREQEMIQEGSDYRARLQGQTQKDVANIQNEGMASRYGAFQDLLSGTGNAGMSGQVISGITAPGRTGGGSVRFGEAPTPSASILNTLTRARLGAAGAAQEFGMDSEEYRVQEQVLNQAIANVFGAFPNYDQGLKDLAGEAVTNPELADLDVQSLISHPSIASKFDLSAITESDVQQLSALLNYARGLR